MQETRRLRLQAVIQEELARFVPREVKDPRIPTITFTSVDVTQDGDQATIGISILGGSQGGNDGAPALSEKGAKLRMQDCLDGLRSASPYMRKHLAKVLTIRHIPALVFKEDRGLENSNRVHELLKKLDAEKSPADDTSDEDE